MPELPEVETTVRGIAPHLINQPITMIDVRQPKLRFPIPDDLPSTLNGQHIKQIERRAKYILITLESGTLIIHLGMSGRLHLLSNAPQANKHDHVDIHTPTYTLRYTDPRRFGAIVWTTQPPHEHSLLKHIGPEPLSSELSGKYLWQRSRTCSTAIKTFLMNSQIVAGVGNIYATEALFLSGIKPARRANRITLEEYNTLTSDIKKVLKQAIKKGGTTLNDFLSSDGKPGYFQNSLNVYGKEGEACPVCDTTLKNTRISNRSSVYCPRCQT